MNSTRTKAYDIDKLSAFNASKVVNTNAVATGVDGQTLEQFTQNLKGNLYRIWNRMSTGSYFPSPVRGFPIPKKSGGRRILGVPDSYGSRPNKSALDAIGVTCQWAFLYI